MKSRRSTFFIGSHWISLDLIGPSLVLPISKQIMFTGPQKTYTTDWLHLSRQASWSFEGRKTISENKIIFKNNFRTFLEHLYILDLSLEVQNFGGYSQVYSGGGWRIHFLLTLLFVSCDLPVCGRFSFFFRLILLPKRLLPWAACPALGTLWLCQ